MGIILKHTFKNIFSKPGRTIILTVCIFLCSLAAAFCVDIGGSIERLVLNMVAGFSGETDIRYSGDVPLDDEFYSLLPDNITVEVLSSNQTFYVRDPQMYSYAVKHNLTLIGVDCTKAYDLGMLKEDYALADNEVILTEDYAKLVGLSLGQNITFYDVIGEKHEFVIKKLVKTGGFFSSSDIGLIGRDGAIVLKCGNSDSYVAYIKINDSKLIVQTEEALKEKYPEADVFNPRTDKDLKASLATLTQALSGMLAACLLMVFIINFTIAERVMSERMSVVGTLRSLGISQSGTSFVLLLENIMYGILGCIPALLLYVSIRVPIFTSAAQIAGADVNIDIGKMPLYQCVLILVGICAIQCFCSIKEIIKASKTAIRDIIFLNKDTEYKFSKNRTILGCVLLVLSVILIFIKNSFAAQICCLSFFIVGVFLLFPYVSVYGSKALESLFEKSGKPCARLAAAEAGSKKSTVASSALIIAASTVALIMFLYSDSQIESYLAKTENADAMVTGLNSEGYMYDYIDSLEGVEKTSRVYNSGTITCEVNGKQEDRFRVISYEDNTMFVGVDGLPEKLEGDEVIINRSYAKRLKLSAGDKITVNFYSDSFASREMTFTIKALLDTANVSDDLKTFIVAPKAYIELCSDTPDEILINIDDEHVDSVVAAINKYSASTASKAMTCAENEEQKARESASAALFNKSFGYLGIILTFIGVVSNQLIGFESRKRECAVLLSVAMDKSRLRNILTLETIISAIIPLLFAIPFACFGIITLKNIFENMGSSIPICINFAKYVGSVCMMFVLFVLTVLFPFRHLKKMNIAGQLKYE